MSSSYLIRPALRTLPSRVPPSIKYNILFNSNILLTFSNSICNARLCGSGMLCIISTLLITDFEKSVPKKIITKQLCIYNIVIK